MSRFSPSLVATLWDVTDKDIDRLSESVLNKLNIDASHVHGQPSAALSPASSSSSSSSKARSIGRKPILEPLLPLSELSVVEAVARSRDECKLTYLTGAAPVVYGMPVWLG